MSFWYYSLPILLKDLFDSESVFGKAVWLWVKCDTKRSPNRWRDQTKCMILDVLLTEYMEWKYFPTESYKCEMQHNACLLFPLISPVLQSILCLCFNPSQTNVFVNYKQVFPVIFCQDGNFLWLVMVVEAAAPWWMSFKGTDNIQSET